MKNIKKNIVIIGFIAICCALVIIQLFFLAPVAAYAKEEDFHAQRDKKILSYYHTPSMNENFAENEVCVILKSAYAADLTEIGLSDFDINNEEFVSLSDYTHTVYGMDKIGYAKGTGKRSYLLTLKKPGKKQVLVSIAKLEQMNMVLACEPSYVDEEIAAWTPNDSEYSAQWGLKGAHGICAPQAWDITRGNTEITVGIMEAGIDAEHPDLCNRLKNECSGTAENVAHGTHVAGIIGAEHNSIGIAGVAEASIRVLSRHSDRFVNSIQQAMGNNIRIINASFHYENENEESFFNMRHFDALEAYDGLFVVSAGNKKVNIDNTPIYPACYNLPNVIVVGAIAQTGDRRFDSNYGNAVDIYAPGDGIISTYPEEICNTICCKSKAELTVSQRVIKDAHVSLGYHYMGGTSMAAPHVAGVAALMLSLDPYLTGAELKELILQNADGITITTPEGTQNVKKLNAYAAVNAVTPLYQTRELPGGDIAIEGLNRDIREDNFRIPSVYKGKTVKSIENMAFAYQAFSVVTFPESVETIGGLVFDGCSNLRVVYFESETPPSINGESFDGCDIAYLFVPTDYAVNAYRTEAVWEYEYADRVFRGNANLALTDWALITDAQAADPYLQWLVSGYSFCVTYFGVSEITDEVLDEVFWVRDEPRIIIYLKDDTLFGEEQVQFLQSKANGGVSCEYVVMREEDIVGYYYGEPYHVLERDYYSVGYGIGAECMRTAVDDWIWQVTERVGYMPVIAPESFKDNLLLLTGLSDALGWPVTVVSAWDEIEEVIAMAGGLPLLFIDRGTEEDIAFFTERMDLQDSYFFLCEWGTVSFAKAVSNNVYIYGYAYDAGVWLTWLCAWYTSYEMPDLDFAVFDAVSVWDNQLLNVWEEYFTYWESLGYTVERNDWYAYVAMQSVLHNREDPWGVADYYDWASYWEAHRTCVIRQYINRA